MYTAVQCPVGVQRGTSKGFGAYWQLVQVWLAEETDSASVFTLVWSCSSVFPGMRGQTHARVPG